MPNGRPGDNPFTDILEHDIDKYTDKTKVLVDRIIERGGKEEIQDLLWEYHWPDSQREAKELEEKLESKLSQLEGNTDSDLGTR